MTFLPAIRVALIWMLGFGGLSAIAGGVLGVVFGGAGVPLDYLAGTPFDSYLIPGVILGVVIGGTQGAAALAVVRRHPRSLLLAAIAGAGMLVWIFAELAIMSEYSVLQTVYFALGGAELAAVCLLLGILRAESPAGRSTLPDPGARPHS